MIEIERLTYHYPNTASPVLENVSLSIPEGAFVLVAGLSGSGKSTFLRALNGLVPHFYGGVYSGRVRVQGIDPVQTTPRELAGTIGFVFQDPEMQFVVETVEEELAFGLENLALPRAEMVKRIDMALADVGATHLQKRAVHTLSGGEAQRVAIASALVMRPQILVLDEPTSELDPASADALLALLVDLHHRQKLTIVLAEHRLSRVLSAASHMLVFSKNHAPLFGAPVDVLPQTTLRPPFVEAAHHFGWKPLPLSIEEARPHAEHMKLSMRASQPSDHHSTHRMPCVRIEYGVLGYDSAQPVLVNTHLSLWEGQCVALLGDNGAGKSTLLKTLAGLIAPLSGKIYLDGIDVTQQKPALRAQRIAYVPQDPNSVLFAETLDEELLFTLRGLKSSPLMQPADFLHRMGLHLHRKRYPRDLSGGERQRAALAAMLVARRPIMLLDEPTRGLDYAQRHNLVDLLRRWTQEGFTIVLATHDIELAARVATRVLILDDKHIQIDGHPRQVFLQTAGYQTELARLFHHPALLTTDDLASTPLSGG